VTQPFNTTTSMGRLTLNVLLSLGQLEREVAGEWIRDKLAASKKKGMLMGGVVALSYRVENRALHIVAYCRGSCRDPARSLFRRYLEAGSVRLSNSVLTLRVFGRRSALMARAIRSAAVR
jgi:site-specific DNA recombinase